MSQQQQTSIRPNRPMQVLALGLPRTGTLSMWQALTLLGYKDVHHGMKVDMDASTGWAFFDRALDATFPCLPTYTGVPFTRPDWDEALGPCEGVTDVASVFGPALVEAYPEAKVVLVRRDFDKWYQSVDEVIMSALWGVAGVIYCNVFEPLTGCINGKTNRKLCLAMCKAGNIKEARKNAKPAYESHYQTIRDMVPHERLLEFDLKQGWRPLCKFLGKDVPEEWKGREDEFPHLNDSESMRKLIEQAKADLLKWAIKTSVPWAGVLVVGVSAWMMKEVWW